MKLLKPFVSPNIARTVLLAGLGATAMTSLVVPALAHRKAQSVVVIRNVHWRSVHVEVRNGNFQNPAQNRSLGVRVLGSGQSWSIPTGEDIFYRRDADPDHPNGRMTDWCHRPVYGKAETLYENL